MFPQDNDVGIGRVRDAFAQLFVADVLQQPQRRGTAAPEGTTTGQAREPLGDKLARSDGVLCPPAGVDPEMRAPTPEGGNTPVIPPPGSPGGDPSVRPK